MISPVKNTGANAIYTGNDRTLSYGVDDIRVNNSSNGNTNSYINFCNSYNGTLTGRVNFQTVEIEVFQIVFPLLSSTDFTNLKNLIGFQSKQLESLYRDTRDGFQVKKIHAMVDGYDNVLVVVKSTTGYIFEGFMSVQYRAVIGYVIDDSAFLFSLTNPSNKPCKMYQTNNTANNANNKDAYFGSDYGPSFGGDFDFYIAENSNSNTNFIINCGITYQCAFGNCNASFGAFVLGTSNFQVADIEIFTVSDAEQKTINASCVNDDECQTHKGMTCVNSVCSCDNSTT